RGEIALLRRMLARIVPDDLAGFALADGLFVGAGVCALIAGGVQEDDDLVVVADEALAWNSGRVGYFTHLYLGIFQLYGSRWAVGLSESPDRQQRNSRTECGRTQIRHVHPFGAYFSRTK